MSMTRRNAAAAVGAALATGLVFRASKAEAACPNIDDAVRAMRGAQEYLRSAKHDFNGHRADALRACDEALRQLGLCLEHPQCR